ncbi:MAG: hypothetical protein LUD22_00095 [Coprobacillus sp.]|nr:hypothetical protein [Coprobacillus sp.]
MKKTKLLTSIATLALVLGLGACEINGDINISVGDDSESTGDTTTEGDETGDGESTPNEPDEDKPTTIDELKFVVTLYVDGEVETVPEYGDLYYYGSFNGELTEEDTLTYGDPVKLEETTNSKGVTSYTYTFKDVLVSEDHDYRLLFYYEDEEVGTLLTSHVLVSYQDSPVTKDTTSPVEYEVTLTESISEKFPDPETLGDDYGGLGEDGPLLEAAFALVEAGRYEISCYDYSSKNISTDYSKTSFLALVTPTFLLEQNWNASPREKKGWIDDPTTGGLTPFTLDDYYDNGSWSGYQLIADAAPDENAKVSDLIVKGSADLSYFEVTTDGYTLKSEYTTEEILGELLPDAIFTENYKNVVPGSLTISVLGSEDEGEATITGINYFYDVQDGEGTAQVRVVVNKLGTATGEGHNINYYVPYEG